MPTTLAFSTFALKWIDLNSHEATNLAYSQFFSTAMASLLVSGAFNTIFLLDVVASLSCEASGLSPDAFDAVHFDFNRQHRGQMTSAANLRQLLEGSKRCVSAALPGQSTLQHTPQIHGPIAETLQFCKKYYLCIQS
jgi:histidine ammonia-lyase